MTKNNPACPATVSFPLNSSYYTLSEPVQLVSDSYAGRTRSISLNGYWDVNTFVNTSIFDAHTFNIIFNQTDIDNIIERVQPAIEQPNRPTIFLAFYHLFSC